MTLEQGLLAWDGKDTHDLAALYETHKSQGGFEDELLVFLQTSGQLQLGASWLIKHHLEQGHKLSARNTSQIFGTLAALDHWGGVLHILQSIPYLNLKTEIKLDLERFIRFKLSDPNKFVRAWAYNGFYELAKAFPDYQPEASQLFEMAMRDEPASVKARVRNILKQGF